MGAGIEVSAELGTGIGVTADIGAGDCVVGEWGDGAIIEVGLGFWTEGLWLGQ